MPKLKGVLMSGSVSSSVGISEPTEWYAMSATFGRALKAKDFLESRSVRCFIPMKYEVMGDRVHGKKRQLGPAISNLLFVNTTRSCIQSLKSEVTYLQYLTRPEGVRRIPIVVPERQMQQFIAVCNTYNEKLVYLNPEEINLEKGTPVQIVGGAFDGIEGTFIKIEGVRNRRVAVLVPGIAAVVIADITKGCLKVLD